MADVQYLNYGDLQQVELEALLYNLANEVQQYVELKPWTHKRKKKFMSAYLDIINKGLLGANTNSGVWSIRVKGTDIDLESKSKKDLEMYRAAAYFIRHLMEKLAKDKPELPVFDGNTFSEGLKKYISDKAFGGNEFDFKEWNKFDTERLENLELSRKERANRLGLYMSEYIDSLDYDSYNFEKSPFKNPEEFKSRVRSAIGALLTLDQFDDWEALNRIGLKDTDWFDRGLSDLSTLINPKTGEYYTYEELSKLKPEELSSKKSTSNNNIIFLNKSRRRIASSTPLKLREKMNLEFGGNFLNFLNSFNNLYSRDLNSLTNEELSNLQGLFLYGTTVPISPELLKSIKSILVYQSASPNRFRRIEGIDGFIWDSELNLVIQVLNRDSHLKLHGHLGNNILTPVLQNPLSNEENKEQLHEMAMNEPIKSFNWDSLDEYSKNELKALGMDILAFLDPEAVTGTALALKAARLRDKNRSSEWTLERALDWGTSSLGGLPILGDALSIIKAGNRLVKLVNRSARMGSAVAAIFSAANMKGALETLLKINKKGITSITPLDIQTLTYALMGFAAGYKTISATNSRPKTTFKLESSIKIDNKKVVLNPETAVKVESEFKNSKSRAEASLKILGMEEVKAAAAEANVPIGENSKVTSGRKVLGGSSPVKTKTVPENTNIDEKLNLPFLGSQLLGSAANAPRRFVWKNAPSYANKALDWTLGRERVPTPVVKPSSTKAPAVETSAPAPTVEAAKPSSTSAPKIDIPAGKSDERGMFKPYQKPSFTSNETSTNLISKGLGESYFLNPNKVSVGNSKISKTEAKKLLKNLKEGKFKNINEMPEPGIIKFKDALGRTHEWELQLRNNDVLLVKKSPSGLSALSIDLDNLRPTIYNEIMNVFNPAGVRSKVELPANVIKILLGTAYKWLKQGGTVDNRINNFLKRHK